MSNRTASTGQPLLILRDVGKIYSNGVVALERLNLSVGHGDFISLLGPSGCGKSTALRLIAGLSVPTRGTLDWQVTGRSSIGFVFQEPTLLPWASVFDNVWLPLRLKGLSRKAAEGRIRDVLDRVHLNGFEGAVPRELSGGMKMRVSIARALVTRPSVLLMDEPFASLDEITRFKLNAELLELREDRRLTVLFVTHSVFESAFLSSRIVVMAARPGRVHSEVAVEEPYPRGEGFRASPAYAALCLRVSGVLADAMRESEDGRRD